RASVVPSRARAASVAEPWLLRSIDIMVLLHSGAREVARLQQVFRCVFFFTYFKHGLLAPPYFATLLQCVQPRLGTEERGTGCRDRGFGGAQHFLRLQQALARGVRLFAKEVDMRLALGQRTRPWHAGLRWIEHPRAVLLLLEDQRRDFPFDLQAGVAAGLGLALALEHLLARGLGAVFARPDQGLQRIARHGNIVRIAAADCSNGTSSCDACCGSLRIGPIFSIAASASGSVPRLYSPSWISSSMSWYLASSLRSWPAARRWDWSTTRGMVRLRLTSTSMAG